MLGTVEAPEFRVCGIRLKAKTLAWVLSTAIRWLGKSLRVRVVDEANFLKAAPQEPCLFAFWHNRIFAMPLAFTLFYKNRQGAFGITSASGEGTLLTMIFAEFGVGTIRGSSSRQGTAALYALKEKVEEGYDIVMTPDGPRGPKYELKPGLLFLAQKTGRPIVPLLVEYSHCLRLGTWDRFMIPLPFSVVTFKSLPLVFVQPEESADRLEEHRCQLERMMKPVTE
ncbi:MAG: lysophospholipid acyltransferase family protein [Terrimicrobiaceae bacterium]